MLHSGLCSSVQLALQEPFNQVTESPDLADPTLPLRLEGSARADRRGTPLTQIRGGRMWVCVCVCGNSGNQLCVTSQSPPFQFISSSRRRQEMRRRGERVFVFVCVHAHTPVSVCMGREGGHKNGKVVKNCQ